MGTGLLTALDSAISNDISQLGDVNGFVVQYSSTTAVAITSGNIEANGKNYILAADTTHTMTSLATGFPDFHYIYIDDSASTSPTAVIIDSTTEPSFSASKRGWYNGDDRCIGVIESPAASSTIRYFSTEVVGKNNYYTMGRGIQMASNMNPTGTWQIPDDNDGNVLTPVNAVMINMNISASDIGSSAAVYFTNKEQGDVNTSIVGGNGDTFAGEKNTTMTGFFPLGSSRKVYISGQNDDDNSLSAWIYGFGISR